MDLARNLLVKSVLLLPSLILTVLSHHEEGRYHRVDRRRRRYRWYFLVRPAVAEICRVRSPMVAS